MDEKNSKVKDDAYIKFIGMVDLDVLDRLRLR